MRQGQQNPKRSRGRGRKPQNQLSRSLESNGPDVKIRGTSAHIYEKYQALARDAQTSGDRIGAENYQQHAEHYYRLIQAAQAQQEQARQEAQNRQDQHNRNSGNGRVNTDQAEGQRNAAEQPNSANAPSAGAADIDKPAKETGAAVAADADGSDAAGSGAIEAEAEEKPAPRRRAPRRRRPAAKADDAGDKPASEDVPA